MDALSTIMSTSVADANERSMRPGDVWVVPSDGEKHTISEIQPGYTMYFVMGSTTTWCDRKLAFTGHARPGKPTCPTCLALLIPAEVVAAAKREPFIHLRRKDIGLRRPIQYEGRVVGFCHPHDTPNGYRLGPIFVLPEFRGRGLTKAAYKKHGWGRRCVAYIHDGNIGSEKAHVAAGFRKLRRGRGGWTWVRDIAAGT